MQEGRHHAPDAFAAVAAQLRSYFEGRLTSFDIEYAAPGTEFQQRVRQALDVIPYGTTTTYGRLADSLGAPRSAVRALAAAIGANPLPVVRPCRRVIGADGSLTGYAGGLDRERQLLLHEGQVEIAMRTPVAMP
ncbi:methylated-DNA--[protein]-cysteine S-methyltransferase [Streptomyces sp. NPDC057654]|uniref:methylated-DNA--[protein]-cysteine S-methyltransferase n=1 Tax=Streptomyces sp. NPDC057654 TaxID=3346196 RepID=UPI003681A3D4